MEKVRDPDGLAITVLRVVVGIFFIVFGQYKVFGTEFTLHGGFQETVAGFIKSGASYPFMAPILNGILAHCATPVAFLVAYGELLIGLSLVFGVLSRITSFFGFVLMTLLALADGFPAGDHAPFWAYWTASENWTIMALCFAALVLARPDARFSLKRRKRLR